MTAAHRLGIPRVAWVYGVNRLGGAPRFRLFKSKAGGPLAMGTALANREVPVAFQVHGAHRGDKGTACLVKRVVIPIRFHGEARNG